jgi:hypothetical protein
MPASHAQPRLKKGSRTPVGSSFMGQLERAVQAEMRRFKVSRSFVIATAVAHVLGVDEQANYRASDHKRGRVLRMVRRAS